MITIEGDTPMFSTGGNKNKVSPEEVALAEECVTAVFIAVDREPLDGTKLSEESVSKVVVDALEAVASKGTAETIASYCRQTLKEAASEKGLPERWHITLNSLCKKAVLKLKLLTKEEADAAFKTNYYKKKSKKA